MSYPAGVVTTQLTFGTAQAMIGQDALAMTVKVTPTTNLVYGGNVFIADTKVVQVAAGGSGAVTLINPDQPGFFNGAGVGIRNWGYTFEITYTNAASVAFGPVTKLLTWFASDAGPLDVDTMVPIADGSGVLVPATTVSSAIAGIQASSAVYPDSYVQAADNGDYALAVIRALAYATPLGLPVTLQRMYPCASTVTLNNGDSIVGFGPRTGLIAPLNAPMGVLAASNVTGVVLDNFTVDGNCVTYNGASKARGIRFVGCSNIRVHRMTVQYIPDWGTSFEQCANVLVTDHVHRAGNAVQYGGRDGVHFLDCVDATLDGAKIHSGDDCVGITSQTRDIGRITVRNVTGVSQIAAVVTLGNEGSTSFNAYDITAENISGYQSPDWTGNQSHTNYVVKLRAQNSAVVSRVRVSNVTGDSSQYGLWLDGNSNNVDSFLDVQISNVNVVSDVAHGIYLNRVTHFEIHGSFGRSRTGSFDGFNLALCKFGTLHGCSTRATALWGIQLNACASVDVVSFMARDCGVPNFTSNTGGNGALINCTDVQIIGGQYVGAASGSYYGLYQSGNTTTVVSTSTRVGGAH